MAKQKADTAWWAGQPQPEPTYGRSYTLSSQYIPMRDGVCIAIDLYLPKDLGDGDQIPTIIVQTRYYRRVRYNPPFGLLMTRLDPFPKMVQRFISRGYAIVMVDVRGSGASFGSRPMEWCPDEVRDGAEIVDWIIAQPWSNGIAGTTGVSYLGTTAEMLLTNNHPAIKAAQIQFALFDVYADISHPGGVRQDGFLRTWSDFNDALDANQLAPLARQKMGWLAGAAIRGVPPVDADQDGRLLQEAVAEHAASYNVYQTVQSLEYRDDIAANGITFDQFSPHAFMPQIENSGTAIYTWSSYYDGAYTLAAVKRFLNIACPGKRLILGPWDHGANQAPDPHIKGKKVRFDTTGEMLRYFDANLKGLSTGIDEEPPVHYYTMGEEAWKTAETWPPPGFTTTPFYFAAGGKLDRQPPTDEEASDTYQADYSATSGLNSRWVALVNISEATIGYPDRKAQDQKLLVYQTAPLEKPVEVTGHPVITLHLRASAEDVQLFVYLEDITPDGQVHYVTEGLFRAIHRQISDEKPAVKLPPGIPHHSFKRADALPLVPGETAVLSFDLLPISYLFQVGHAIRIAIAGADKDNFQILPLDPPQIEILRTQQGPSHITLPISFR